MTTLPTVIVGLKGMGRPHPRTLIAVADLDEASAKTVAKGQCATAYTDYRALLAKETLDALDAGVHTNSMRTERESTQRKTHRTSESQ